MKMSQLIAATTAIAKLTNSDMPGTISYRWRHMLPHIQAEMDLFCDLRKIIAEKYGIDNGDGTHEIPPEYIEAAQKELNELNNLDIETMLVRVTIPLTDKMNLSAADIIILEPLVNFILEE